MYNTDEHRRLIYPDIVNECHLTGILNNSAEGSDEQSYSELVSNVFFDLANASEILYRIRHQDDVHINNVSRVNQYLVFQQDMGACSRHTGGIIWETAYLLLEYLLEQDCCKTLNQRRLGRTCELGAGVGFLGQCLVAEHCTCVPNFMLTETANVITNLKRNVTRNQSVLENNKNCTLSVTALDWICYKDDIEKANGTIKPHSFDTLLSTDVIFSTSLVQPLLETAAYLSHDQTIWYLCVQIRCTAAHNLFMDLAASHGFHVEDISNECYRSMNSCAWGETLECFLFRITRTASVK
jgi:hypothetical protein